MALVSEKTAAFVLNVHTRTLRRWRQKGDLPYYLTPGGRIRYEDSDLYRLRADGTLSPDVRIFGDDSPND